MSGAGTGLDALKISHDIQHSQRALPALDQGKNTITCSAGPPRARSRSRAAPISRSRVSSSFTPTSIRKRGPEGRPLDVGRRPGPFDLSHRDAGRPERLRFGCHYRARDVKDGWDFQVSFDDGKTFQTVDRAAGPTPARASMSPSATCRPAHGRPLVRFAGTQRNTTCLFDYRIDADYQETRGGFRPIKVTYQWEENGQAKEDVHVMKQAAETYTITCAAKPVMKAIRMEWAE